jgi:hypothetical protein
MFRTPAQKFSALGRELDWISLLDYKHMPSYYSINDIRFAELEVRALGKYISKYWP